MTLRFKASAASAALTILNIAICINEPYFWTLNFIAVLVCIGSLGFSLHVSRRLPPAPVGMYANYIGSLDIGQAYAWREEEQAEYALAQTKQQPEISVKPGRVVAMMNHETGHMVISPPSFTENYRAAKNCQNTTMTAAAIEMEMMAKRSVRQQMLYEKEHPEIFGPYRTD